MEWSTASSLDRVEQHRDDEAWVARIWASADSVVLPVDDRGRFPVVEDGSRLRYGPTSGDYHPSVHHLLGISADRAVFCMPVTEVSGTTATLREAGHRLPDDQADVAFGATALTNWHRLERFCGGCGAPTQPRRGGLQRSCSGCGRASWPRTDPAVIVAVSSAEDQLLLAHQHGWPEGRVSVLAGFVETGESLEQALHREILEEAGVRLADLRYVASQPWPFPRSLMLGFRARALTTELRMDTEELAWGAWYSRDRLREELVAGRLALPTPASLAHRLVLDWWGSEELPDGRG